MTVGSRSTKMALGTCFPDPVSLKKVVKESSESLILFSEGMDPSGAIPCSRQYNSQHELPICTPACPTWIEIHSLWKGKHYFNIPIMVSACLIYNYFIVDNCTKNKHYKIKFATL